MNGEAATDLVGYFGFGSLVNPATLRTNFVDHVPARLKGWRRHWQTRPTAPEHLVGSDDELVLLSIHEDAQCVLDGAIVIDHASSLAAVDEREAGYDRVELDHGAVELLAAYELPSRLFVYVAQDPETSEENKGSLLQSYLDAVMQGYMASFGPDGVAKFVDTTSGFGRTIVQDRHAPIYPRSVNLAPEQAEIFDRELIRAGVRFA